MTDERMTAILAKALEDCTDGVIELTCPEVEAVLATYAALAKAEADTARLDWLESYGLGALDVWKPTFRAAIDAAMEAK